MEKQPKFTVDTPAVIERCTNPVPANMSMICPHCGSPEVFCDKNDPDNTDKWFWAIKAYKVDNYSHCTSCDTWFKK